jgi:hypothetical protein
MSYPDIAPDRENLFRDAVAFLRDVKVSPLALRAMSSNSFSGNATGLQLATGAEDSVPRVQGSDLG